MKGFPSLKTLGHYSFWFGVLGFSVLLVGADISQKSNQAPFWLFPLLGIGSVVTLCWTITLARICEILLTIEEDCNNKRASNDIRLTHPILNSKAVIIVAVVLSILGVTITVKDLVKSEGKAHSLQSTP